MRRILPLLPAVALSVLSPNVLADQATAIKSGCAGCHQLDRKTVGPSIKAIAQKHKGADIGKLVGIVKAGRSGENLTWGKTAMPASPAPEADVHTVIEWMLSH